MSYTSYYKPKIDRGYLITIPLVSFVASLFITFFLDDCMRSRSDIVHLNFSEYSQIERDASKNGYEVDPLTTYLCLTNDASMKVFEAWAITNRRSPFNVDKAFATELEIITQREYKQNKRNFDDIVKIGGPLVLSASSVMQQTKQVDQILPYLGITSSVIGGVWREDKTEHTKTEYYTEEECSSDSKGNRSCRTVTKSRTVCDYYEWEYWYDHEKAIKSISLLKSFDGIESFDIPPIEDALRPASQSNAENEWANEWSSKNKKKANLNEWIETSVLVLNLKAYRNRISKFESDSIIVEHSLESEPYYHETTSCYSSYEPPHYDSIGVVKTNVDSTILNAKGVIYGVRRTPQEIRKLDSMIEEFIAIQLDGKNGNVDTTDIVNKAEEIHALNFTSGRKFFHYSVWYSIIIFIALNAVLIFSGIFIGEKIRNG